MEVSEIEFGGFTEDAHDAATFVKASTAAAQTPSVFSEGLSSFTDGNDGSNHRYAINGSKLAVKAAWIDSETVSLPSRDSNNYYYYSDADGDSPKGFGPMMAVDGDRATSWRSYSKAPLILELNESAVVKTYKWATSAGDPSSDPIAWLVQASVASALGPFKGNLAL